MITLLFIFCVTTVKSLQIIRGEDEISPIIIVHGGAGTIAEENYQAKVSILEI